MEKVLEAFRGDDLAAKSWLSKYALRDKNNVIIEELPDDMHKRLAKQFHRMEVVEYNKIISSKDKNKYVEDYGNLTEEGKKFLCMTEEEIYELFKDFKYVIPGGSVMSMLGNPYQIGSLSNCFVIGQPSDSYGGIMKKRTEQAELMKRRGGVGKDLSLLRPKGSFVNNAAKTSTGPVSFMEVDSEITREVAQDGRRGALMLTISVVHPDSDKFIISKLDTSKITGANISVKLTDEFMKAAETKNDFIHRFPINSNIDIPQDFNTIGFEELEYNKYYDNEKGDIWIKKIHAEEFWKTLIHCAWKSAEPGIMFEDRHLNYSPDGVYEEFKGVTTNPCGEIFMQPYDSCRLIHVNFAGFVVNPFTKDAYFDYDKFYDVVYKTMKLGDNLVSLEIEAIDRIIEHIESSKEVNTEELELWQKIKYTALRGRRAGVGFTGLADAFAMLGITYASEQSLEVFDFMMKVKFQAELNSSIDMAIMRGTFEGHDFDKEFIYEQRQEGDGYFGANDFYEFIRTTYPKEFARMFAFGRRNISWSTVAPTGTVSILAQVSSGIEPIFLPYYERMKKCMSDSDRVDFTDATGEKFTKFYVLHPMFKEWILSQWENEALVYNILNKEDLDRAYKNSPWYGADSASINWEQRIELQAIAQKYTTHSISSTINLPKETTEEVVSNIYMEAWHRGLKGVTVYRDGSRDGILNSVDKSEESDVAIIEHSAPKRPKVLDADLHIVTHNKSKYAVIVGLLSNKPFEVFAFEINPLFLNASKLYKGKVIKLSKGSYKFESEDVTLQNLQARNENSLEERACTLYTSMLLRHGVSIPFVIKTTRKVNGIVNSFSASLSRVLNKYTEKEVVSGEKCPECGGEIIREAGCTKCTNCGHSHCLILRG